MIEIDFNFSEFDPSDAEHSFEEDFLRQLINLVDKSALNDPQELPCTGLVHQAQVGVIGPVNGFDAASQKLGVVVRCTTFKSNLNKKNKMF